jgi:tetratricopeptide (TPR) repeat protein
MSKLFARLAVPGMLAFATTAGCAHGTVPKTAKLSPASQVFAHEASALPPVAAEEDYFEAKLVYQALPEGAVARVQLREKLLDYLLGPLATLDAERLRKNPGLLGNEDDFQRLHSSFRDALELFSPSSLWTPGGIVLGEHERGLLRSSAKLVLAAYSPRGNELPVATALFALQVVDPNNPEWKTRLEDVLSWLDTGSQIVGHSGPRRVTTTLEVLDSIAAVWPTPAVLERLSKLYGDKQERVSGFLRRPMVEGARGLLSELLLDTDALSAMSVSAASIYLRCGQMDKAREAAGRFTDRPGDDAELRQLLAAAAGADPTAADYLALARRFLPRNELLRGTSTDRVDPAAAMGVLQKGLAAYPAEADMLVLASRVARMLSQPLLSLRYLDEASAALASQKASSDVLADLAAERMELAFLRLKMHIDPDRMPEAERQADGLRREFAEARGRFGASHFRLDDADIDYLVAGGLVDAGQIEKAAPLLARAQRGGDAAVDVTRQLANLALKRGEPQKAIAILQQALDLRERSAPAEDTIPYVEGQAKLSYLLGNAYEIAAGPEKARKAWTVAVRGWERLMLEQLRRKNLSSSAEATFEVGRLYYLLGRREEGMRKFDEAIAQDEDRDQTYLDAIAFLVQRGEADTAVDIYRRAMAKAGHSISEYVKVYSSLWIADLTRRSSNTADAGAMSYLRAIADRKVMLRAPRAASWYTELARYAVGQIDYQTLLDKADTAGKRAETYFYEAMRRLSKGQREEAHALWSKVVETKMLSFFEFEMASRYLRTGAPARPEAPDNDEVI